MLCFVWLDVLVLVRFGVALDRLLSLKVTSICFKTSLFQSNYFYQQTVTMIIIVLLATPKQNFDCCN